MLSQVSPLNSVQRAHVAVVGAGLSGLRSADLLLQYGFDVTILEGRDRVGGRLHQQRLPNGHLIDVGPNWIHGTSSNPILDLAKQTKTVIGSWDAKPYMYDEDGQPFPVEDGEDYSAIMWGIILDAFKHSEKHCMEINPEESLLDFFHSRIGVVVPETQPGYQRKREIVMRMAELWGAFIGSPISRQSLKYFWLEECLEGGKTCFQLAHRDQADMRQRTYFVLALIRRYYKRLPSQPSRAPQSSSARR